MPIPLPPRDILTRKSMHERRKDVKEYVSPQSEFYEVDIEDILTSSGDSPMAAFDDGNTNEFGVYK